MMELSPDASAFIQRMRELHKPKREIIKLSKTEPRGDVGVGLCWDRNHTMIITIKVGKQ